MRYYVRWDAPRQFYPPAAVKLGFDVRVIGWDPSVPWTRIVYDAVVEASSEEEAWQAIQTIGAPKQGVLSKIVARPEAQEKVLDEPIEKWSAGEMLPPSIEVNDVRTYEERKQDLPPKLRAGYDIVPHL